MVLVIDNFDSFVFNLAQYLGELGWQPLVFRNNQLTLQEVENINPSHIVISPGPCTPLEAGISNEIIHHFAGKIPILGVCLGHQCIGYVYGGSIVRAAVPTHGKSSAIFHDGKTIYQGLPNSFIAGRYHSLIIEQATLPVVLTITSCTEDGVIMGVRHKEFVVEGVQFHPESIMTNCGHDILKNFLSYSSPIWR